MSRSLAEVQALVAPPPTPAPTAAEVISAPVVSRRAAKAAAIRRSQREEALQGPTGSRSLAVAAAVGIPGRDEDRPPILMRTRFLGALTIAVVATMAAIAVGAPVLGHSWRPGPLAISTGGALLALWWAYTTSAWLSRRFVALLTILALCLTASFALGAARTTMVNGKPVLVTSPAARAAAQTKALSADIDQVRALSRLAQLTDAQARTRLGDLSAASAKLDEISSHWSNKAQSSYQSSDFAAAGQHLAAAAHFGSLAITSRVNFLNTGDPTMDATATDQLTSFVTEAINAEESLRAAVEPYGLQFGPSAGGPVE